MESKYFWHLTLRQFFVIGICAIPSLPATIVLLRGGDLSQVWWGIPLTLIGFLMMGEMKTHLTADHIYFYSFWGLSRFCEDYKNCSRIELIKPVHFYSFGNDFDVRMYFSIDKANKVVDLPFNSYQNWHELTEFLLHKTLEANPSVTIDSRIIEKLQQYSQ